jgi:hypothetical protein
MKRILVAFACAAGMLLVLSSSCDDNDFTSAGGGSKGASGLDRMDSPFPCSTGGGSGDIDARFNGSEVCSGDYVYTPARGACYQLSGGYVVISFDRDETDNSWRTKEVSIQFLVPEEGFTTDTYDIDAGEAIFRAKRTGKREELYDSSLCAVCSSLWIEIDAINGTLGTSGSTLDISWNAAAGHVEDNGCDNDVVHSDSGGNGGYDGIPYM